MLAVCLTQVVNQYLIDGHYDGEIKRISGDSYDFTAFVKKQMQLYKHASELFLDRDVVKESDAELVELLKIFTDMYPNVRVTIIYEEADENNPEFIVELLKAGIYNIVTADEVEDINAEIDMCLSAEGMTVEYWMSLSDDYAAIPELIEVAKEKLLKNTKNKHIYIYSSQNRVGGTTATINLAKYLQELGSKVLIIDTLSRIAPIMTDKLMCDLHDDYYIYQYMHYAVTVPNDTDYNFILHDCGTRLPQNAHAESDYIVLVGRADVAEVDYLVNAIDTLKPNTVVLTAVPETVRESIISVLPGINIRFAELPNDYMFSGAIDKNNEKIYAEIAKSSLELDVGCGRDEADELEI